MALQDSEYPILKAFAPVYAKRVLIDRMIQAQQHNQSKVSVVEDFLSRLVDECDFSICVPAQAFDSIVESDFIMNSIELGVKGSTMGGSDVRMAALENIYGIPMKDFPPEQLPKYGIFTGQNKMSDLGADPDIFYHYGALMLNLRKENFMDRATLTVGSSLNFNESIMKTPTPVWEPKSLCVKGYPTKPTGPGTRFFRGLDFLHHLIVDEGLSIKNPNSISMKADGMLGFENFEIQLHGKIQFSKDVKSITVCQLQGNEMDIVGKHAARLNDLGITFDDLFGGF